MHSSANSLMRPYKWLICFGVFINFVGIGALIPVLPFTVIDGLGHSDCYDSLLASFALPCLLPILCWAISDSWAGDLFLLSLGVGAVAHLYSNDIMQMFAARPSIGAEI